MRAPQEVLHKLQVILSYSSKIRGAARPKHASTAAPIPPSLSRKPFARFVSSNANQWPLNNPNDSAQFVPIGED